MDVELAQRNPMDMDGCSEQDFVGQMIVVEKLRKIRDTFLGR